MIYMLYQNIDFCVKFQTYWFYILKKLHKSFKTQPDSIVLNQGCHILQSIFIDKGTYVTSPFVKWNITVG